MTVSRLTPPASLPLQPGDRLTGGEPNRDTSLEEAAIVAQLATRRQIT